jgi:hypothetical protein
MFANPRAIDCYSCFGNRNGTAIVDNLPLKHLRESVVLDSHIRGVEPERILRV